MKFAARRAKMAIDRKKTIEGDEKTDAMSMGKDFAVRPVHLKTR